MTVNELIDHFEVWLHSSVTDILNLPLGYVTRS